MFPSSASSLLSLSSSPEEEELEDLEIGRREMIMPLVPPEMDRGGDESVVSES